MDDEQRYRLVVAEGTLVWARYTVMVSINTVVIGFTGLLLRDSPPRNPATDHLGAASALLGLGLSVVWYKLTDHGWRLQQTLTQGTVYASDAARPHASALRRYALAASVAFALANLVLLSRALVQTP